MGDGNVHCDDNTVEVPERATLPAWQKRRDVLGALELGGWVGTEFLSR